MPVKNGHVPVSEVPDWMGSLVLIAGVLLFLSVGQSLANLSRKKKTAEQGGPLSPLDLSSPLPKRVAAPITMAQIDQMDGLTFERFLKALFEKQGYETTLTPHYDWGGDLVLHKNGVRTLVQAKRWNQPVTMSVVQEVVAAKAKYRANRVMVVTNSQFTHKTKELARVNDVVLWNRDTLGAQLRLSPITFTRGAAHEFAASRSTEPHKSSECAPLNPAATQASDVEPRVSRVEAQAPGVASPYCALCGEIVTPSVANYCRENAPRFNHQIYCFSHQRTFACRPEAVSAPLENPCAAGQPTTANEA